MKVQSANYVNFQARCCNGNYGVERVQEAVKNKIVFTPEKLHKELQKCNGYSNYIALLNNIREDTVRVCNMSQNFEQVLVEFFEKGFAPQFKEMTGERPKGVRVWKIPIPFVNLGRQLIDTVSGNYKERLNEHRDNIKADISEYLMPYFNAYTEELNKNDIALNVMYKINAACEQCGGIAPKEYFQKFVPLQNSLQKSIDNINFEINTRTNDLQECQDNVDKTIRKKRRRNGISLTARSALTAISIASMGALTVFTKPIDLAIQLGQEIIHDITTNSLIESGVPDLIDKGFEMLAESPHIDLLGGGPVHNALANAIDIGKHMVSAGTNVTNGIELGDSDIIQQGFDIYNNLPEWNPDSYAVHGRTRLEFIQENLGKAKDYVASLFNQPDIAEPFVNSGTDGFLHIKSMKEFLA